jgi:hypothetical protein
MSVSPTQGSLTTTFAANLSGHDPDGDPVTFSVDWGDGTVTTGSSSSHRYNAPGEYVVTGKAEDSHGSAGFVLSNVRVCAATVNSVCGSPDGVGGAIDGAVTSGCGALATLAVCESASPTRNLESLFG